MDASEERNNRHDEPLELVIEKVSTEHGFDVRGYKRSTLYRRIRKRMQDAGCAAVDDYLVRLETDRHEYAHLVNTILINVTEFFRDPPAWEFLQEECLRPMLRRRPETEPLRVWSVGCATGEEAYSLSICLTELLGDQSPRSVKIYATDMDDGALAVARAGIYGPDDLRNVSPERLERFFEELPGGRYKVRRDVRASVIFGRHNVLVDPPISRLDLLVCRNLMIYFDSETQQQLLSRFHYAVREDRYLFLGKAETLMTRSMLFQPVEPRFRIFQRVRQGEEHAFPELDARRGWSDRASYDNPALQNHALHAIIDRAADPMLLLDASGRMLMASEPARDLFNIGEGMLGRSLVELEERFRPVPLRLAIEDARTTGRTSRLEEMCVTRADGSTRHLSVEVRPIPDARGAVAQLLLWARDLTRERQLEQDVHLMRQELETTSEELQTANEELETANDELRARQEEMNDLAHEQAVVFSSLQMGLVVLQRNFTVVRWNRTCEDTWGVREEEAVGQDLFCLDAGLPFEQLREPLLQAVQGKVERLEMEVDATNRRGRPIRCRARVLPLRDHGTEITGALLLIDEIRERT
jgi:two-component system CheB/CheR fusion protein